MNSTTFLIVCPLVFLAGFVDAIGGGGGLISLPAYLFAGIPVHTAIGTNKFSAVFGTTLATGRFAKQGMIEKCLALPAVAAAFVGASIGARLSLRMPERMTLIILLVILPFVAFLVLNKKLLRDRSPEEEQITGRTYATAAASAFLVGIYDGLYGPGTGTFLIVLLNVWSRLGLKSANGQAKAINLATNLSSLIVFLMHGTVLIPLGLSAAVCNMIGAYLGAGLALKQGSKAIRPVLLLVLVLLFVKIISQLLGQ